MRKNTKKLNRILVLFVLVVTVYSASFSAVQAASFDWLSGSTANTSKSLALNLISSYLKRDNRAESQDKQDGSVQNSDGVSVVAQNDFAVNVVSELIVAATAYSSTPDQTDDTPFITALGTTVRDGIIATNFLPFGTKVMLPEIYGNKIFVVEDRMNRRYWHTVDIWFPDRASALEFGFKKVKIQILES